MLVDVLPLVVVLVDVAGLLDGGRQLALHKQIDTLASALHAPGGIDTRAYLEDNVAHGNVSSAQSADVDDGAQTHARVLVEYLQAMEGENAVFVGDGHDVGCYAHRTEVEQGNEPRERYAVVLGEGLHQFEPHTATAQVLEGVGVVFAFGIEDGYGVGQLVIGYVMVADDEVYAQ